MPWLKYEICYAYGYAPPEYVELLSLAVDERKREIREAEGDGLREPRWEVIDALPPEVLEEKVLQAERSIQGLVAYRDRLISQRKVKLMDHVKPNADKEAWELQCYGCTEAELEELIKQVNPLDCAMIAVSMLSDAQHEILVGLREEARQTINRAKWMIRNYLKQPG